MAGFGLFKRARLRIVTAMKARAEFVLARFDVARCYLTGGT
jgi:hypothetical protein